MQPSLYGGHVTMQPSLYGGHVTMQPSLYGGHVTMQPSLYGGHVTMCVLVGKGEGGYVSMQDDRCTLLTGWKRLVTVSSSSSCEEVGWEESRSLL